MAQITGLAVTLLPMALIFFPVLVGALPTLCTVLAQGGFLQVETNSPGALNPTPGR